MPVPRGGQRSTSLLRVRVLLLRSWPCKGEGGGGRLTAESRGPTRRETRLTEAESYANLSRANSHWGLPVRQDSILCENRALDSYQNILFSLTLFYARFHAWPSRMTIVSHAFKRPRIVDGHCAAIGWPLAKTRFVGIDPPGMQPASGVAKHDAVQGVAAAVGDWAADPHGRGEKLRGKRTGRNPHGVWQGVFEAGFDGRKGESRLITEGEGDRETLVDSAPRPWI